MAPASTHSIFFFACFLDEIAITVAVVFGSRYCTSSAINIDCTLLINVQAHVHSSFTLPYPLEPYFRLAESPRLHDQHPGPVVVQNSPSWSAWGSARPPASSASRAFCAFLPYMPVGSAEHVDWCTEPQLMFCLCPCSLCFSLPGFLGGRARWVAQHEVAQMTRALVPPPWPPLLHRSHSQPSVGIGERSAQHAPK